MRCDYCLREILDFESYIMLDITHFYSYYKGETYYINNDDIKIHFCDTKCLKGHFDKEIKNCLKQERGLRINYILNSETERNLNWIRQIANSNYDLKEKEINKIKEIIKNTSIKNKVKCNDMIFNSITLFFEKYRDKMTKEEQQWFSEFQTKVEVCYVGEDIEKGGD